MKKKSNLAVGLILFCLILSSCSGNESGKEKDIAAGVAATLTKQAYQDQQAIARSTQAAKDLATATPKPVVHVIYPDFSPGFQTFVTDISSAETAPDKNALGDYYQMNKLERPFTANEMDYFGDLDITRVDLKYDEPWFYATIILEEDLRDSGDVYYGLELDLDADGRGDNLIWVALPPIGDWTTDGVKILVDQNGDVGGEIPLHIEEPNPNLDGYETVIFDAGYGDDPDLAWVRRDPEASNQLQISFKDNLTGQLGFLWSAWSDGGLMEPGFFDYNDRFTHEGAGSPSNENINYPVMLVELVDSTCRSWYGITPLGTEPGLCGVEQAEKPEGGKKGPKTGFCIKSTGAAAAPSCVSACLAQCPVGVSCMSCTMP